jgi:hypothetical protein
MSDSFLSDSNAINWQTGIWKGMILGDKTPPVSGDALNEIFEEVKIAVDKIRSRGGKVIFIRTPSSHMFAEAENAGFPREVYWDKLLAITKQKEFILRIMMKQRICFALSGLISPVNRQLITLYIL